MPTERWTFVAAGEAQILNAYKGINTAAQKTERSATRSAKKQAQAWSAAKRPLNETEKLALRVARTQERAAKKAATAQIREAKRAGAARAREAKKAAVAEIRAMKRVAAARRRTMGRIAGGAIRAVGVVGGAGALVLGAAARQSMQLRDKSIQLAVKGGRPQDAEMMRRKFQNIAIATPGAKAAGLAAGAERFVAKTGDIDAALRFSTVMAEMSVATGTAAEDIGGAMADMYEKFDITTVEGMSLAMAELAVQGKKGAFELEDAARQFPKMAAAAARFGLGGVGGLGTLGGLAQIARRATPSGEEAATAVESMFKQLIMKADMIQRETGAKVFRDKGKRVTGDIKDILVQTIAGAGGNLQTMQKIFDVRGVRAVSPLISVFNRSFGGATGTEQERLATATKALREEIEDAINVTGAETEMKRDLAAMQQQSGVQLTAAWEALVAEVMTAATPAMGELATSLSAFVRDTDFSGLSEAVMALVEGMGIAVGFFESLGWIERKGKDPVTEAGKQRAEAEAGLAALGLTAKQKADIAPIAMLENVAMGGGMDPADLAKRLEPTGVTPMQFQKYLKFTGQRREAGEAIHAGDPTRQQTVEKLMATGMSAEEAQRRTTGAAEAGGAMRPGGIDIPLLGRVPLIGAGLDEPLLGPAGGATKEQEAILRNFATSTEAAAKRQDDAAIAVDKMASSADRAQRQLERFAETSVFKL